MNGGKCGCAACCLSDLSRVAYSQEFCVQSIMLTMITAMMMFMMKRQIVERTMHLLFMFRIALRDCYKYLLIKSVYLSKGIVEQLCSKVKNKFKWFNNQIY